MVPLVERVFDFPHISGAPIRRDPLCEPLSGTRYAVFPLRYILIGQTFRSIDDTLRRTACSEFRIFLT